MKKIKLFSLVAAALFAGSTMAADVTLFEWTCGTTAPNEDNVSIATGDYGNMTVGTAVLNRQFGTNAMAFSTYYKLGYNDVAIEIQGTAAFEAGDNVLIVGKNGGSGDRSFEIGNSSATQAGTKGNVFSSTASNTDVQTFTAVVDATVAGNTLRIFRLSGKTMYVQSIKVVRPSSEPECPSGLTITGDAEVYAGDKMTLTATLAAGNGEIAYQWYKDGTAAENAIAGATGKTYVVESFSAADAGSYYCQASKADCEATINAEAFAVALKEIKNITCETDKYLPEVGTVVEDRMTVTTPSVKLTLGTGGWTEVKEDSAPEGYGALIAGSSNPSLSGVVPTAGCFYKFEVSKNATLNVAVKINSGKSLYVIKGTESIGYTLAGKVCDAGSSVTESTRAVLSFSVEPSIPYYIYCQGSKLGIFGFEIPGEDIGSSLNQAQVEAKAVKVIRDGQLLIIRDGKTYTAQGAELQ